MPAANGVSIMEAAEAPKSRPPPMQLSLRIRHPSMDPALISRELAIEAEHSFKSGEPRHSRSGLAPSVHAETYWLGILEPSTWLVDLSFSGRPELAHLQDKLHGAASQSLGWTLSLCATRFRVKHSVLLRQIRADGGHVSLLIALAASVVTSFSITPEVSRTFSELGITLEFELTDDES
jgi:hypothetical protein